jgi:hypothetical protein
VSVAGYVSPYRTAAQVARIKSAEAVGYVHHRDSDYKLGRGRRATARSCLCVLFGNSLGHERAMVVYPDGSVETQARKRGGSTTVTFNRRKLEDAMRSVAYGFVDE